MIDCGEYFTINRPRQYGKTILLNLLERKLSDRYIVISISFEGLGGSLLFLAFMRSIINGTGFAFTEVHISEEKRLDVEVTGL